MSNEQDKINKENLRLKKLKEDEADSLAREKARTIAYMAREQEIEKAQKIKEDQRAKDRAAEETRDLAKEKARKEAYFTQEKKIADDLEARKK